MRKLFFCILLLCSFLANAQTWTPVNGRFEYQKIRVDDQFRLPLDTLASAEMGSVAVKGGNIYVKRADGYWYISSLMQLQGDWNQSNTTSVDYIKNKPANVSAFTNDANYFKHGGNSFGATAVLGTTDNFDFDFYTNNTRRGRWTKTGNLLLGMTTDRGYMFDLNGKAMLEYKAAPQLYFDTQFGGGTALTMGYEVQYQYYIRTHNGGQGFIQWDFSGLNSLTWNIDVNNNLVQSSIGNFGIFCGIGKNIWFGDNTGTNTNQNGSTNSLVLNRSIGMGNYSESFDPVLTVFNGRMDETPDSLVGDKAYWYRTGFIGIGTTNKTGHTMPVNPPRAALTINQGTHNGWVSTSHTTRSTVVTHGSSVGVVFRPNNGNNVITYGIQLGTKITANGETRTVVTIEKFDSVTVDAPVDWSSGYEFTYRNPYIDIADGSNPFMHMSDRGNISLGSRADNGTKMDITGTTGYDQLRLATQYTPTGSADTNGNAGDIAVDDNYFYFKTSTGWKRAALTTF